MEREQEAFLSLGNLATLQELQNMDQNKTEVVIWRGVIVIA
ncbi:MAG: hypothetical protein OXR66_06200 [Candidatus Woesearchaeota archaeon]|nr:hypothetical protein [Candidatus Woesearchaeota archaeon]